MGWGDGCEVPDLAGRVALVTGASRGCGRGIALALGDAGATVYVTGRTREGGAHAEGLPGSVGATAEEVTARGGRGVPLVCDHGDDRQIEALAQRLAETPIDILVNNVWGGYEGHDLATFAAPVWEQPSRHWAGMFERGLRAHILLTGLLAPGMIGRGSGLIVTTTAWDRNLYLGNLYYDVAKHAINRFAWGLAKELRAHGVVSLALAPGWMRTERVMAAHAEHAFDLAPTESPEFCGRGVAFLASDPEVAGFAGQTLKSGDLAARYGFVDIDGRRVPPFEIDAG